MTKSKYEVVPGLWIGSEKGDIDREIKQLLAKRIDGDWTTEDSVRFSTLTNRRMELMMPIRFRQKH
jgi:hypothetical protein